jgi:hypothetical protein
LARSPGGAREDANEARFCSLTALPVGHLVLFSKMFLMFVRFTLNLHSFHSPAGDGPGRAVFRG